jgi:hypothetical protein
VTAQKEGKPSTPAGPESSLNDPDPFRLEGIFEDATQIFKPNRVKPASSHDVIIAVDTNVLLLPYTIRKDGLPQLQNFYQALRTAKRLYLPARVAREFIVNRDKKLAELLKMIKDVRSRINIGETKLSPVLEGVEGSEAMVSASKALAEAKNQYTRALGVVEERIQSWSGDDPVTQVYDAVFDETNIISPRIGADDILAEWNMRLMNKIPPGYKDSSKIDSGIGDFLVWKALLALGEQQKKDLIFVTGEEKADWFVRVNGAGAYARPELVAEYRKHSGGKGLRLVEFHDVLREMDVDRNVVMEVEKAETSANKIIRASSERTATVTMASTPINSVTFANFATRYGGDYLLIRSDGITFRFQISECKNDAIYIYPNGTDELYAVGMGPIGRPVQLDGLKVESGPIMVAQGQTAYLRSPSGFVLAFRLMTANIPDTDQLFEITATFAVFEPNHPALS